jgi:glycoprotein 3-alpha-L-fucosyltransferase
MGARPEDYEKVSPYKSFLHVDQFSGPKDLAKYLLELDKDDDAYNMYFMVRLLVFFVIYNLWWRRCDCDCC